jgi:aldose 1-epimerase
VEPITGRTLTVLTTEPGLQFYSGNFLDGTVRGVGGLYPKHFGFTLEAQHYPDSLHHDDWPTTILRAGQTYKQTTVYRFSQGTSHANWLHN